MTTTAPTQSRFGANGRSAPAAGKDGAAGKDTDGKAAKKGGKAAIFKSKKFIIALVVVLVAAFVGYKMLMPTKVGPPKGGEVVPMDAITLNLADGHYLKIGIAVQLVEGKATADKFSTSQAADLIISEFSDRTVESLSSNKARERLMTDLVSKLKVVYPGEVYDAFFTNFTTQ